LSGVTAETLLLGSHKSLLGGLVSVWPWLAPQAPTPTKLTEIAQAEETGPVVNVLPDRAPEQPLAD
jgi:hypothetical protein